MPVNQKPACSSRGGRRVSLFLGLVLALVVASWLGLSSPLPAAYQPGDRVVDPTFEPWEYMQDKQPSWFEPDLYRLLRQPADRPAAVQASLDRMERAKRDLLRLANGTRWGEDRTIKYLLYTCHFDRAKMLAKEFRDEYPKLLNILSVHLIDDPDLPNHILKLRDWGRHTAIVEYEPIFPRHPYGQIDKVMHE